MTEQENTETEIETESEADIELRRQVRIQLDEQQKLARKQREKDLGAMTDEQLRAYSRQFGYDAI
jgi:hypothetical protein